MTLPEILKELQPYTGRFPMTAMRAAVEQRDAIIPELLKELETCAEDPADFASLEGIERDTRSRPEGCRDRHYVITDAINEMEWWAAFHLEDCGPSPLPEPVVPIAPLKPIEYVALRPFVREPQIGRNDLCPCGSGKTFKSVAAKVELVFIQEVNPSHGSGLASGQPHERI